MSWRAWFQSVVRLALLIGLPWPASSINCKAGWQEWNQACYKVSTDQTQFSNALTLCKQHGANLASIHSPQENEFVLNLSGGKDVFIGLSDTAIEGTFVWSDGSTVAYTNWEDGEPDDDYAMGDCVILRVANGKWNDTPCIMWYEYVCKFTISQPSLGKDKNVMSREQTFITHEQKALRRHVIYKQFMPSLLHCALLCAKNPSYKSINYNSELGKEEGECQLNDATAEDFPLHLVRAVNSTYGVPHDLG